MQRLQDADASVVRSPQEAAMKQQQSAPDYIAAVKAVDQAYQAFREKKNALVDDLTKTNPIYCQMKAQATAIDSQIESARQNPATTPEQIEEFYKNRETFIKQWRQARRVTPWTVAGITPLKQQWLDASKKLADLAGQAACRCGEQREIESRHRHRGRRPQHGAAGPCRHQRCGGFIGNNQRRTAPRRGLCMPRCPAPASPGTMRGGRMVGNMLAPTKPAGASPLANIHEVMSNLRFGIPEFQMIGSGSCDGQQHNLRVFTRMKPHMFHRTRRRHKQQQAGQAQCTAQDYR